MGTFPVWVAMRYLISAIGVWVVARGVMTETDFQTTLRAVEQLIGAGVAVAPALYGVWKNWNRKEAEAASPYNPNPPIKGVDY